MGLAELIERLGKATEGNRELDLDIAVFINAHGVFESAYEWRWNPWGDSIDGYEGERRRAVLDPDQFVRFYSTSIDAALTLVPEGAEWLVEKRGASAHAGIDWPRYEPPSTHGHADTPALALCIAALKAIASSAGPKRD